MNNVIDVTRQVKPVHILRRLQLGLFYWFDSKRQNLTPRTVDFTLLLHELHMATFTPPVLPAHLFGQALAFPSGTPTPSLQPSNTSSVTPTFLSDLSSLTGLLLSSQASQSIKKPTGGGDALLNPSPDKDLDAALAGQYLQTPLPH
mmetsp:Transcript_905/g.1363  ORF Transcript_905/g.1363 Transcript_905/m.1363 type:complete len:146 (+) Transcript_905:1242-1679(+)